MPRHVVEIVLGRQVGMRHRPQQFIELLRGIDQEARHIQRVDRLHQHADTQQLKGGGGLAQITAQGCQRLFATHAFRQAPRQDIHTRRAHHGGIGQRLLQRGVELGLA
ncbi:hypothetical protein D9M68_794450 [compost metagenome]